MPELQALLNQVNAAVVAPTGTGAALISAYAESNKATETTPAVSDYTAAGVTGVTSANLASINSALDSQEVNGAATTTAAQIQLVVDGYKAILAAADGVDNLTTAANPTQDNYKNIGVTGVDTPAKLSLLGDVIDSKAKADVDTVPEVQALADAVAAVLTGAAGGTPPTLAQLQLLGLTGLNPANLAQVQKVIAATPDDGTGVDTLPELQGLVNTLNAGLNAISAAAQANNATESSPTASDYANAGVTGVDASNLASINSALNSAGVDGKAVDSTPEIQALVDSYKAILDAADGQDNLNTATNPTLTSRPTSPAALAALPLQHRDASPLASGYARLLSDQGRLAEAGAQFTATLAARRQSVANTPSVQSPVAASMRPNICCAVMDLGFMRHTTVF
jgi:hypothetical protein